jgi:hypothetical protein
MWKCEATTYYLILHPLFFSPTPSKKKKEQRAPSSGSRKPWALNSSTLVQQILPPTRSRVDLKDILFFPDLGSTTKGERRGEGILLFLCAVHEGWGIIIIRESPISYFPFRNTTAYVHVFVSGTCGNMLMNTDGRWVAIWYDMKSYIRLRCLLQTFHPNSRVLNCSFTI